MQGPADAGEHVSGAPCREHVRLQLRGREVAALGQVAEGAPGGHGVGECDPDPSVHVAAGVQVALVHREPTLDLVVLDPHDLDAEVAREAPPDPLPEQLGSDRLVGQAARSSSAPPS